MTDENEYNLFYAELKDVCGDRCNVLMPHDSRRNSVHDEHWNGRKFILETKYDSLFGEPVYLDIFLSRTERGAYNFGIGNLYSGNLPQFPVMRQIMNTFVTYGMMQALVSDDRTITRVSKPSKTITIYNSDDVLPAVVIAIEYNSRSFEDQLDPFLQFVRTRYNVTRKDIELDPFKYATQKDFDRASLDHIDQTFKFITKKYGTCILEGRV